MSYDVLSIPPFDKQLKKLAKKYPSLKADFAVFLSDIALNPTQGKALGKECYKYVLPLNPRERENLVERELSHILLFLKLLFI